MESEEIISTSSNREKLLEDRIYKLERDLLDTLTKLSRLEVQLASIQKVELALVQCRLEMAENKIDAIGQALRDLIVDLIREEKGREGNHHKVKIIRRQNLIPLSGKEEIIEPRLG